MLAAPANYFATQQSAPCNLQAEQALLGALLINNQAAEWVPELAAEHFFDPIHGRIFAVMSEMLMSGRTFTATTLAPRFQNEKVGDLSGAQYLGRLMSAATTIINVREYARLITDLSQRRMLAVLGEDLASRAFDTTDAASPAEIIEDAERQLFHASLTGKNGREVDFSTAVAAALDAANTARQSDGKLKGVSTGFADLDRKVGGLSDGSLIIIAGRPSMGKTALATNIAHNVAQAGDHVHFFSLEMTSEELAMRQLGEVSGVSSDKLRRGDFEEGDYRKAHKAAERLAGLSMTIDETGGITMAALAAKARRMARRKKTRLIVVDYLQIMGAAQNRGGNRVADLTEITVGLKALAKELCVPIIALSQLSRAVETRTDKRPQLSDLRESGSIEQDADVVMFVYRDEYYVERAKPDVTDHAEYTAWQRRLEAAHGKAEVIIGKQRHGPIGIVPMAFHGELTRFSDLARGDTP